MKYSFETLHVVNMLYNDKIIHFQNDLLNNKDYYYLLLCVLRGGNPYQKLFVLSPIRLLNLFSKLTFLILLLYRRSDTVMPRRSGLFQTGHNIHYLLLLLSLLLLLLGKVIIVRKSDKNV